MKNIILAIVCLLIMAVTAQADEYQLTWDAPTTNEGGSTLTDLGGYNLYDYGVIVQDMGNVTSYIHDVPEGKHKYTARAYDLSGHESKDSNSIIMDIVICPEPPTNFNATKVE